MSIPPVTLNLLQLLPGDDQGTHTDKINYNFDQILSLGGGPPGDQGIQGLQGVPGSQGIQGFQGLPGTPGSKWYIQPTTPSTSPAPNIGDYWFDTATLNVYEWDGSSWNITGTLFISGVFQDAIGDSDRVIFANPTPLKSLVLSPINYGVGAPTGGTYKLKLIGSSGSSMMNFGVVETGSVESPSGTQSYISMSTLVPNSRYSFNLVNPAGPIEIAALGTTLRLNEQTGTGAQSNFDFNGSTFKIQVNPNHRNLGFATAAGSGLSFHVGLQDAVTNPASRGLSLIDQTGLGGFWPKLSLRGAHDNPVAGDTANSPIFLDSMHPQLSDNTVTLPSQTFWRFRHNIGAGRIAWTKLESQRMFDDPGNGTDPERSVSMLMKSGLDSNMWHYIGFTGGAKNTANNFRPTIKMGAAGTGDAFMMDVNGFIALGSDTFIKDYNSASNPAFQLKTKLHIQASGSSPISSNAFGGMNFNMLTPNGYGGITATGRGPSYNENVYAGMHFKESAAGIGMMFGTSNYIAISGVDGVRTRMDIEDNGIVNIYGRDNFDAPGKEFKLSFSSLNDIMDVYAYDALGDGGSGMYRHIVLQPNTDSKTDSVTSQKGGGFVGIGSGFNGFMPQTKLHVRGAVTFGNRNSIIDYTTSVGLDDNWTFGIAHANSAARGLILGGSGNTLTATATESVIIGDNGIVGRTVSVANTVSSVAPTFIGTGVPYFSSSNPTFTKTNNLSIYQDGTGNYNGIELVYTYNALNFFGPQPDTAASAALLVTNRLTDLIPNDISTSFVVRGDGRTGVMTDIPSTTDPGFATPNMAWVSSEASSLNLNVGRTKTSVVLGMFAPTTSNPTPADNTVITTISRTSSANGSELKGKHLMIHPGITRNVANTLGSGSRGGDLILRGGTAQKAFPVATSDQHGYVRLAQDAQFPTSNAGAVSVGVGTPFNAVYVGRIRMNKTGVNTGTATVLAGTAYNGAVLTTGTVTATATEMTVDIVFPVAFVTSNVLVVCSLDTNSSAHSTWNVLCISRSSTGLTLLCRTTLPSWSTGVSVDTSFIAYCLP